MGADGFCGVPYREVGLLGKSKKAAQPRVERNGQRHWQHGKDEGQ